MAKQQPPPKEGDIVTHLVFTPEMIADAEKREMKVFGIVAFDPRSNKQYEFFKGAMPHMTIDDMIAYLVRVSHKEESDGCIDD